MRGWQKILYNNRYFLLVFFFFGLALISHILGKPRTLDYTDFQGKFKAQEKALNQYSNEKLNDFYYGNSSLESGAFYTHIYKKDSLIAWNTNQLPVERSSTKIFPGNGLIKLKNGWYYFSSASKGDFKVCSGFLIKKKYSYKNDYLENSGNLDLSTADYSIRINFVKGSKAIYTLNGEVAFYVQQINDPQRKGESSFLIIFLLLGLTTFLFEIYKKSSVKGSFRILFFLGLLSVRWFLFHIDFNQIFGNQLFLSPELFAYNEWSPTIFDFSLNIIFSGFFLLALFDESLRLKTKIGFWIKIPVLLFVWAMILKVIELLVLNSTIELDLEELFKQDQYTILVIFIVGLIFYFFLKFIQLLTKEVYEKNIPIGGFAGVVFLFVIAFSIYRISVFEEPISSSFLLLFLLFASLFFYKRQTNGQILLFQVLVLGFTSVIFVSNLNYYTTIKDLQTRKLYANLLAVEQDINLELSYTDLQANILQSSDFILGQLKGKESLEISDFGYVMENKFLNGTWDAYEISCNLYGPNKESLISKESATQTFWDNLITRNGEVSEINNNIYLLRNEISGYNYVIRQALADKDSSTLIIGLKSKRIPEEIGFPRLLISDNSKVFNSLEKYSIANYSKDKLIKHYGGFNYPSNTNLFKYNTSVSGDFNQGEHNHYYYNSIDKSKTIVISLKNKTGLEVITAISYVFCLWGVGLIIIRLLAGGVHINATGLDLSFKIQFFLVLVVLVSLVFFGIGSGFFVEKQYKVSAQRIIQEKLNSVELELKAKVFEYDVISERANGNFLEGIVIKLSKVFVTDINIYDPNGFLVASSRAKIFNSGLLSKQINPLALSDLKRNRKSYFSHIEQIGSLSYISSYIPFYNGKGVLLGYANLQRFGQQRDFELQIQEFIVAIVNVFILLLGISIIFSLIVSNWLTSPLRLLKQKVDSLKIASENQQIDYAGSDEIGLIVKAYNQKIGELQEASIQLAKNERESAWREMAKQVAHEIKNPLTPMKLSIQHLLRTYDPKDPDSKIRIETLLSSLIEQIDGLTRIANEFSNFAQMPGPRKVETDLIAIIKNAIALFESEVTIKIVLKTNLESAILNIDKDQWGQALNNLIKNSLQALIEVEDPVIIISLENKPEENAYVIKVNDNGRGIKKEDLSKVFTPYFTTKSTGTGIGLFLVKQIVENHNGTISFETKENKGTTFSLVIPKTGN